MVQKIKGHLSCFLAILYRPEPFETSTRQETIRKRKIRHENLIKSNRSHNNTDTLIKLGTTFEIENRFPFSFMAHKRSHRHKTKANHYFWLLSRADLYKKSICIFFLSGSANRNTSLRATTTTTMFNRSRQRKMFC